MGKFTAYFGAGRKGTPQEEEKQNLEEQAQDELRGLAASDSSAVVSENAFL